jgi:hypothetical protein
MLLRNLGYHVAPLIRVRMKLKGLPKAFSLALAMVIDPGMFDKPVLLSTWLAAQENTSCSPDAHVTKNSIQPGSAYTPAYGGAFSTDSSYTSTEATLGAPVRVRFLEASSDMIESILIDG